MYAAQTPIGGMLPIQCESAFVTVPASTLPGAVVVPPFRVGRYLASRSTRGAVQVSAAAQPWVHIDYHMARAACAAAGLALLTELQALAIALDIARQGVNWTGGAVGSGKLFQGLRKHSVGRAQGVRFVPPDPDERRWHLLSNGERIYDFAGNAFSWVFDDVQGDAFGVVRRAFAATSPTIAAAPAASLEQGVGWRPSAGREWYGRALARGGCFESEGGAGVFAVIDARPATSFGYIGFRCVRPA